MDLDAAPGVLLQWRGSVPSESNLEEQIQCPELQMLTLNIKYLNIESIIIEIWATLF
jgi:hypothetical protein